jgi:hypothetical protein
MFGTIDSRDDDDPSRMPTRDGLFDRQVLLDVLVNVVPLGILLFFVLLFLGYGPYPSDPLVVVVQVSLILVPRDRVDRADVLRGAGCHQGRTHRGIGTTTGVLASRREGNLDGC